MRLSGREIEIREIQYAPNFWRKVGPKTSRNMAPAVRKKSMLFHLFHFLSKN